MWPYLITTESAVSFNSGISQIEIKLNFKYLDPAIDYVNLIRTYAEPLYLVGTVREFPLQVVYKLIFCVSPVYFDIGTYTTFKPKYNPKSLYER